MKILCSDSKMRLHIVVAIISLLCLGQAVAAPTSVTPQDDKTAPAVTEALPMATVAANSSQSDNRKIEIENKFVSEPTTSRSADDGVAKSNEAEKENVTIVDTVTPTTEQVTSTKRPRKTMKLKRPRTSMATQATTTKPALPTDDYFISGLSDLLLENHAFDRIDELLTEGDTNEPPTVVVTTMETKAVTSDTSTKVDESTEVVEQRQQHDHSTTDKPIEDVDVREPSTTTLSPIETTLSPIIATTPEMGTTTTPPPPSSPSAATVAATPTPTTTTMHGTIATEKTINVSDGESFDEHTTIDNRNIADELLFRKLKNEEDEKLNVKTKASNNTKKKALKQSVGVGGAGGKGQSKKPKLIKKLALVEEAIDQKLLDASQVPPSTLNSMSTTTAESQTAALDDTPITASVHISSEPATAKTTATTTLAASSTMEQTTEATTLVVATTHETTADGEDNLASLVETTDGGRHDAVVLVMDNSHEQPERANSTNISNIEIVTGDNFVKITNSSGDVVDVEITESDDDSEKGEGEERADEILFKMNVFAVGDRPANASVGRTSSNGTGRMEIPTESLEIIIIEENDGTNSENREQEAHRNDDLFEVIDHGDGEKSMDESMEKPPDLIFQANVDDQKADDDFFTTVFEDKASADVTKPPNAHFQEEIYVNHPTTIKVELPTGHQTTNHNNNEDEIKLKTTEKDSDTTFYISNTEVKVIETNQTPQPNTNQENQFFLAPLYEEDVIIDFSNKNSSGRDVVPDKYEADIILSPLSNSFDGISDINYIGESFLNIEEITTRPPQSGVILNEKYYDGVATSSSSSSDIIIEPVLIPEVPLSMPGPVMESLPPQIELGEMIFNESDDDEYILNGGGDVGGGNPFFINDNHNRSQKSKKKKKPKAKMALRKEKVYVGVESKLIKSPLTADLPRNASAMSKEEKMIAVAKLNSTGQSDNYTNATAFLIDDDDSENGCSDLQTLFLACFATVTPLVMSLAIAIGVRYFWKKHRRECGMGNGMVGDNSTDPLAAKSQNGSADEVKVVAERQLQKLCKTDSNQSGGKHKKRRHRKNRKSEERQEKRAKQELEEEQIRQEIKSKVRRSHQMTNSPALTNSAGQTTTPTKAQTRPASPAKVHSQPVTPEKEPPEPGTPAKLKSMESGLTIERSDENLNTDLATNNPAQISNHSGANGSVITMTLKNNHLIVETEERNDISRDTRETKVHYSPSEKDGVFIVESSRGADQAGSFSPKPTVPSVYSAQTQKSSTVTPNGPVDTIIEEQRTNQQEVQVHTPPTTVTVPNGPAPRASTGLSQSDLSISSSNGSNQNYTYGNQEPYTVEVKGYCGSSPVQRTQISEMKPLIEQTSPTVDPDRPVIKAAIFKGESQDISQDPVKDAFVEGGAPLSSDIDAFNNNNNNEKEVQKNPPKPINGIVQNGLVENGGGAETLDSLSYLPEPPTSDEIKQYNDLTSMDMNTMDSLPPPSPPPPTDMPMATANGVLES